MLRLILTLVGYFILSEASAQMIEIKDIPNFSYTRKLLISKHDTILYRDIIGKNNELSRTYNLQSFLFFDIDDTKKYVVNVTQDALVCMEGYYINGKKSGNFVYYLLDSLNPQKKYKVWEQNYKNDKKNGIGQGYTIQGVLAASYDYKNDSLVGKSILFGSDGKRLIEEVTYGNKPGSYTLRTFNDTSGKLLREELYENYSLNGKARDFYPGGQVEMEEFYIDGKINGTRKHFYPSGKRWTEVEYRNGKAWTALGSFLEDGRPLFPGTLSNGTGVVHIYNKYGEVQESHMFLKGDPLR